MVKTPILQVAAALIIKDDKILIGKRKHGQFAGKWEFPGGKIEPGETPKDCLERELREELGVDARILDFFGSGSHTYSHATVRLLCYLAEIVSEQFSLADHSEVRWVTAGELEKYDFPEADRPVVERLKKQGIPSLTVHGFT